MDQFRTLRRERERGKIVSGFTLVVAVLLVALYVWQWKPWHGAQHRPLWVAAVYFGIAELFGCRLYVFLPTLRYSRDQPLSGVLADVMGAQATGEDLENPSLLATKTPDELRQILDATRHRWYQSLWIPSIAHLGGVSLLVHYTGGPFDSAIAGIPAAIITAAMLISTVSAFPIPRRWREALRVAAEALWHFKWALLIMLFVYISQVVWQHLSQVKGVPVASNLEKGLVLSMTTLFTTIMTFIGRAGLGASGKIAFKEE
jgi:hypothetical protein